MFRAVAVAMAVSLVLTAAANNAPPTTTAAAAPTTTTPPPAAAAALALPVEMVFAAIPGALPVHSPPAVAVRTHTACTGDLLCTQPPPPPDPLEGLYGRYACRFATAGRVTPCCPGATETLSQFWSGPELAIADYIIGRESGCNPTIINFVGCIGWWQMCGKSCPPNGCGDAWSATVKARQLYDNRRWCDWFLAGDPVTGRAC